MLSVPYWQNKIWNENGKESLTTNYFLYSYQLDAQKSDLVNEVNTKLPVKATIAKKHCEKTL